MENILEKTNHEIALLAEKMNTDHIQPHKGPVYAGVDIGTANVVTVIVGANGKALAGEITPAKVTREGMIVDYLGAVEIVNRHLRVLEQRLQVPIKYAMSAIPPCTEQGNVRITTNILEAAGLEVVGIIDEPEAAALTLGVGDGAIVDVGGGTTGISYLQDGKVVFSADEPTGGFQFDLVLAGHFGITIEEAEQRKRDSHQQKKLFVIVRPVMEKVASIVQKSLAGNTPPEIYLVGGCCAFQGFCKLIEQQIGIPTKLPDMPLLTTPHGIALACWQRMGAGGEQTKVLAKTPA